MHQLLAHDPTMKPAMITNRFIDGLREDVRSVVLLHRPVDLDTACSLALLQEEVTGDFSKKEVKRVEFLSPVKQVGKFNSVTSPKNPSPPVSSEDRRAGDYTRTPNNQSLENKLSALMKFRKAKGLCYKCGLKWNPSHRCANSVPLHVVEELWQLVQESEEENQLLPKSTVSDSEEDLCAISIAAIDGSEAPKTMRFLGKISDHKVIILADSGSSGNFISESVAAQLPNWQSLPMPIQVKLANGNILTCTHELCDCAVLINGHQFFITLKILPLSCYDIILGMDWLEMHSPMEVHWKLKWMSFLHQNTKITLQGVQPDLTTCPPISSFDVKILQKNDDLWCVLQLYSLNQEDNIQNLPSEIAALVNKFSDLFEKPTDLPPKRPYDHSVQLIPGAQPFRLRPYRYNPAQKDEIEKQVNELLQNGMIQASVSPFASPVLLVKKKTGDWRLCVDYR